MQYLEKRHSVLSFSHITRLARLVDMLNVRLVKSMATSGSVEVAQYVNLHDDIWYWGRQYILSGRIGFPRKCVLWTHFPSRQIFLWYWCQAVVPWWFCNGTWEDLTIYLLNCSCLLRFMTQSKCQLKLIHPGQGVALQYILYSNLRPWLRWMSKDKHQNNGWS